MSDALIDYIPTLLMPQEKKFPFDATAITIVKALYARNWQVPGIKVEFSTYGTGQEKWTYLSRVIGYRSAEDESDISNMAPKASANTNQTELFILKYGRSEGSINENWNYLAGISEMIFPEEKLRVFYDNSGPNYHLYVGPGSPYYPPDQHELATETAEHAWHEDRYIHKPQSKMPDEASARKRFMHDSLVLMKMNRDPRIALCYKGCCINSSPYIINDTDLGRSYKALGSEPQQLDAYELYRHFDERLMRVLERIVETPPADVVNHSAYYHVDPKIPYESVKHPLEDIYTVVGLNSYDRVTVAKSEGAESIPRRERYAFKGSQRLMCLSEPGAPEIAYDGFSWCGHLAVPYYELSCQNGNHRSANCVLDIPFYFPKTDSFGYWGLFKVVPKYANGCYVADSAPYMRARKEMWKKIAPRDRLSDEELREIDLVRAKTIVPLVDYDGTYEQPFLLINRELDFDEIELMGIFSHR